MGEAVNRGSGKSLLLLAADGVWCFTTSLLSNLGSGPLRWPCTQKVFLGAPKLQGPHVTACSSHLLPGKPCRYSPPLPHESPSKQLQGNQTAKTGRVPATEDKQLGKTVPDDSFMTVLFLLPRAELCKRQHHRRTGGKKPRLETGALSTAPCRGVP